MAAARFGILPPVQVFGLEGRYATALYSAASKEKALDAVDKDMKVFSELKQQALDSVMTKKKANALTANLFGALTENGRLSNVEGVIGAFETIMAAVRGEVLCEVTTAKPLDAIMKKELESSLKAFLQPGESLQLTLKVDPSIIGGMLVSVGDKYIDMSMATKINRYTGLLQQAV
ncbi:ATP synthase subunit O-like [Homarus americanus]|uniref:Oligomycin sensitivity conferral protein n=1 Tax=Homarus americanus TaxID=6706 RepID=A0A8J5TJ33_HOMAM|nr:ATP synthase subunit O-like [Homarus americanus]